MIQLRGRRRAAWATVVIVGMSIAGTAAGGAAAAPAETSGFTTPGEHAYTVPDGVTRVDVVAIGGEGGSTPRRRGGRAARIVGTLDVSPGQTLYAVVGASAAGTTPGDNGGGAAGGSAAECTNRPGAGGGATDIRTVPLGQPGSAESRVLVAGGGGGAGSLGTNGGDPLQTYGGIRGQGGGSSTLGGFGGAEGTGGKGGGDGTDGKGTTGGRGGVGDGGAGGGCGGGGGGGYGAGGAGSAGSVGNAGGGGGGGGSLVPGGFPAGVAKSGEAPSVTFSAPGRPAPAGPLAITSTVTLRQNDQGGGPTDFTNCPTSCQWNNGNLTGPAPGSEGYDFGYASTQSWGSASNIDRDFAQSFASIQPGPAGAPAGLGEPFLLADFAHYNTPIRGDSPTSLAIQSVLTVRPPAGAPAEFRLLGHDALKLVFSETDNAPPCDPAIQVSTTPCDDRFSLPARTATTTVAGVTWHFTLLGWRTPEGAFALHIATEEAAVTQADIYGQVSVDTNPTTSTLAVDDATPAAPVLMLRTTPVPQTGGTVTFTDGGAPIAGCADLPVDASDGATTCAPSDLPPGAHSFAGSFSGGIGYAASQADAVPYTIVAPQTIDFDAPTGVTYGDTDVVLGAIASSGLPVGYASSTPVVCTTDDAGALQVLAAGTCTVTASQAGDATYSPAERSRTFAIAKARLTVTAADKRRQQGEANPPLTATISGFVNDDPPSVVAGTPALSTTAKDDSAPGSYPITVSVAGMSAANYDFAAADGVLEVQASATTAPPGDGGPSDAPPSDGGAGGRPSEPSPGSHGSGGHDSGGNGSGAHDAAGGSGGDESAALPVTGGGSAGVFFGGLGLVVLGLLVMVAWKRAATGGARGH